MNDWVWECNCTWGLYTAISLINEYCEQLDGIAGVRAIPMDFLLADALIHRKNFAKTTTMQLWPETVKVLYPFRS